MATEIVRNFPEYEWNNFPQEGISFRFDAIDEKVVSFQVTGSTGQQFEFALVLQNYTDRPLDSDEWITNSNPLFLLHDGDMVITLDPLQRMRYIDPSIGIGDFIYTRWNGKLLAEDLVGIRSLPDSISFHPVEPDSVGKIRWRMHDPQQDWWGADFLVNFRQNQVKYEAKDIGEFYREPIPAAQPVHISRSLGGGEGMYLYTVEDSRIVDSTSSHLYLFEIDGSRPMVVVCQPEGNMDALWGSQDERNYGRVFHVPYEWVDMYSNSKKIAHVTIFWNHKYGWMVQADEEMNISHLYGSMFGIEEKAGLLRRPQKDDLPTESDSIIAPLDPITPTVPTQPVPVVSKLRASGSRLLPIQKWRERKLDPGASPRRMPAARIHLPDEVENTESIYPPSPLSQEVIDAIMEDCGGMLIHLTGKHPLQQRRFLQGKEGTIQAEIGDDDYTIFFQREGEKWFLRIPQINEQPIEFQQLQDAKGDRRYFIFIGKSELGESVDVPDIFIAFELVKDTLRIYRIGRDAQGDPVKNSHIVVKMKQVSLSIEDYSVLRDGPLIY